MTGAAAGSTLDGVLLAHTVAVLHGLVVVLVVTGALVALRRPCLLLLHAPVAVAVLGLHLADAACPLTTLELALRADAGGSGYRDGFIAHYVVGPLGLDLADTVVQVGIYAVVLVPNVLAYALLSHRLLRRRPAGERLAVPAVPGRPA